MSSSHIAVSPQQQLNKLMKIKQEIIAAGDYLALEKQAQKLQKLRSKLSANKISRDANIIIDTIEQLIKEKTKYFKQKMLQNSSKILLPKDQGNKTLKYSKSAENVAINAHLNQSGKPRSPNTPTNAKTMYKNNRPESGQILDEDQSQPQLRVRNQNNTRKISNQAMPPFHNYAIDYEEDALTQQQHRNRFRNPEQQSQIFMLHSKLANSEKKIQDLNKKLETLEYAQKQKFIEDRENNTAKLLKDLSMKREQIVDEYSKKLREKGFMVEDLKGKNQYLKAMNQELKNRVLNQQRRNQDYINQLKSEIKSLKKQLDKYKKEQETLNQDIDDLEEKNQGLINELKKLANKLESEQRDKEQLKKNLTTSATTKTQELQRQINHLSIQTTNINKLQLELQNEIAHREQIQQSNVKLQSSISEIQKQLKECEREKEKLEDNIYRMIEENNFIKQELKNNVMAKELLAEQLIQVKDELDKQLRLNQGFIQSKNIGVRTKMDKLKEVKALLQQMK